MMLGLPFWHFNFIEKSVLSVVKSSRSPSHSLTLCSLCSLWWISALRLFEGNKLVHWRQSGSFPSTSFSFRVIRVIRVIC